MRLQSIEEMIDALRAAQTDPVIQFSATEGTYWSDIAVEGVVWDFSRNWYRRKPKPTEDVTVTTKGKLQQVVDLLNVLCDCRGMPDPRLMVDAYGVCWLSQKGPKDWSVLPHGTNVGNLLERLAALAETADSIRFEMAYKPTDNYTPEYLRTMADRLEAAIKREKKQ